MNGILEFYKDKKIYDEYQKELEYAYVRYLYATFVKSCLKFDYEGYCEAVNCAIKNVKEHFPHYRRNSCFYNSLKGFYLVMFNKTLAKLLYKIRRK